MLDSKGLEIAEVSDGQGKPLKWTLGAADPDKGAPLTVALPGDGKQRIVMRYQLVARRRRPAMADAGANRRQETSLSA